MPRRVSASRDRPDRVKWGLVTIGSAWECPLRPAATSAGHLPLRRRRHGVSPAGGVRRVLSVGLESRQIALQGDYPYCVRIPG
jgi:hypothetical protein